jgi:hypothetical protein
MRTEDRKKLNEISDDIEALLFKIPIKDRRQTMIDICMWTAGIDVIPDMPFFEPINILEEARKKTADLIQREFDDALVGEIQREINKSK